VRNSTGNENEVFSLIMTRAREQIISLDDTPLYHYMAGVCSDE